MVSASVPAGGCDPRTGYTAAATASSSTSPHAAPPVHAMQGSIGSSHGAWQPSSSLGGMATVPAGPPPMFYFTPGVPPIDISPESPFVNAGVPVQHNAALPGGLHEWHMPPHFAIDPALTGDAHAASGALTGGAHAIDPALTVSTPVIDPMLTGAGGAPAIDPALSGGTPAIDTTLSGAAHAIDPALSGGAVEIQFINYDSGMAQGGRTRGRGRGRGGRVRGRGGG
ncbi:hypothetical protein C2E23DRAFT_886638 [Lenzites betulinus]|nr:hypothetical protein C2E23DRAFT_886638 [Lenzites betulinus]